MIRCDRGHEHDELEAALACVRVTKLPAATETLPEARSPEPAPNPSTERHPGGRPRVHASAAARQRAYRDRVRLSQ
jgi:hypothetical protein